MPPKPVVLTDCQPQEVETLAALLDQEQIADSLGIGRTTFQETRRRDPEVAERFEWGKAKAIAHVANRLLQKVPAGWRGTERVGHAAAPDEDAETGAVEKLRALVDAKAAHRDDLAAPAVIEGEVVDAGP